MAEFVCDQCGKCCVSLGPLITIERQLNEQDYYCRSKIDNSLFLAHVDPVYSEEITDEFSGDNDTPSGPEKKSCRFLRMSHQGTGYHCAIYSTRPKVCRDFRCYRMVIYSPEGKVCGRVIGKNTLRTDDTTLGDLWRERISPVLYSDPVLWNEKVSAILTERGYRADVVE
jgi:Fe-S-cluster containining protein